MLVLPFLLCAVFQVMTGTCLLGAISLERLTYFNTDVHPARRVSLCYTFEHRITFLRLICGAGLFCYARPEGRRDFSPDIVS